MLTVWSVRWGNKYPVDYVLRHKRMVAANLGVPHQYHCLTDDSIPNITCVPAVVTWPGWWQKISLFAVSSGPSLYLDLDVLVVGNLDDLVKRYCDQLLAMPLSFSKRVGLYQSSVMAWSGAFREPFKEFEPALLINEKFGTSATYGPDNLRSDQEYLSKHFSPRITTITEGVLSYKMSVKGASAPPADCCVVAFHGKPDYHEVSDAWVLKLLHQTDGQD